MTGSGGQASGIPNELLEFWRRFEARGPRFVVETYESQLLEESDGVLILGYAPATSVDIGSPPRSEEEQGNHTYIWVISDDGIRYIEEAPVSALNSRLPKHTNLTGGQPAYIGGQLWFAAADALFVSGGSGRYPPIHEQQLEEAVRVFEAYGYNVTSLGWNPERDTARRFRSNP